MSGKIIDGKALAKRIREEIKKEVNLLKEKTNKVPGLAVILVGDDKASHRYVAMKEKACEEVGIKSFVHRLDKDIKEEEILNLIDQLNKDEQVNGILVQLPLPKGLDEKKVNLRVSPAKDVDGFHPYNTGRLFLRDKGFIPCTPKGIIKLIKSTGEGIEGKNAVVIGRSNIVGKPTALLMLNENATVTICHSKTTDLENHVKNADILVVAVGVPELVKGHMIKEGSIVIDAGINVINGKIIGDVEFEEAKERAAWITPVPGGVGPMTIAMLLENTLEAFKEKWL
jgi:methylenetetrahydrofolate dehydrogenase (NADP+)/methenyltetrahydrofolate cyclohydrolase